MPKPWAYPASCNWAQPADGASTTNPSSFSLFKAERLFRLFTDDVELTQSASPQALSAPCPRLNLYAHSAAAIISI